MGDFFSAMRIAGSGMSAQRSRLNVVASNLANAQTTRTAEGGPYRRRDPVFEAVQLTDAPGNPVAGHSDDGARAVEMVRVIEDTSKGRTVFDPDHPDADADGYVELPNVEMVEEMVNMITATRSYSANATVLQTIKQMAQRAIDLIR
jgi:flagellar basal-body rod protein FlgC